MSKTETNCIENKEQLNEDFEQEVIAFLNYREGGAIYIGIRKNGQVVGVNNTFLGWYEDKEQMSKEIMGIKEAFMSGTLSYELKYNVEVEKN